MRLCFEAIIKLMLVINIYCVKNNNMMKKPNNILNNQPILNNKRLELQLPLNTNITTLITKPSSTSNETIDNLNLDELNKKWNSNNISGSIKKINKFLYSILKHQNQTLVIFNQTILLRNLTAQSKIESNNGKSIGVHDFREESPIIQFLRSFVLNFFSEIGDKSFFCIVVFYNQVSPIFLFTIAVFAELLMNLISVIIGYEMTGNFSTRFFKLAGMWAFIFFGLMSFYEILFNKDEEEEEITREEVAEEKPNNSFTSISARVTAEGEECSPTIEDTLTIYLRLGIKVFSMIFLAEFGDKSQITTIILTTECSPLWIFLGTALAHIAGITISMFIGYILSNKINFKMVNIIGAIAFVIMGIEMGVSYYKNPIE